MKTRTIVCILAFLVFSTICSETAVAIPTEVTVRVISKGGKFVGTSMGGASVIVKDLSTGEILARGITQGSTGNTELIMDKPRTPGDTISDETSAKFTATIDIDEPTHAEISAYGPLAQKQSANAVSITQWLIPGRHITAGDAIVLELPGFVVDILAPPAHVTLGGAPQIVKIRANVMMMCGCPLTPGGIWDSAKLEIKAVVKKDGKPAGAIDMKYAGEPSQFEAEYAVSEAGTYEVTVYAFDATNGNTGLDKTTFMMR